MLGLKIKLDYTHPDNNRTPHPLLTYAIQKIETHESGATVAEYKHWMTLSHCLPISNFASHIECDLGQAKWRVGGWMSHIKYSHIWNGFLGQQLACGWVFHIKYCLTHWMAFRPDKVVCGWVINIHHSALSLSTAQCSYSSKAELFLSQLANPAW